MSCSPDLKPSSDSGLGHRDDYCQFSRWSNTCGDFNIKPVDGLSQSKVLTVDAVAGEEVVKE